jgi:hypothetical protein
MTVIVLDNDETTGFYTHLLTYMGYAVRCRKLTAAQEKAMIPIITRIAETNGVFRPGTAHFLRNLAERKRAGLISSIVMYTNAYADPNSSWHTASWGVVDWPHFIARVLSCLAGVEDDKLFDVVLSRLPSTIHIPYPTKSFERVVNALKCVRPVGDDERIIFFDDKPLEILGASDRFIAWKVAPYTCPLINTQIYSMMDEIFGFNAVSIWPGYTRYMIMEQILTMSYRCNDALVPVHRCEDAFHWCGFNMDVHIPLPVKPTASETLPVPGTHTDSSPVIKTLKTYTVPAATKFSTPKLHIRIHLELALKVRIPHFKHNPRNKYKKQMSPDQLFHHTKGDFTRKYV